MSTFWNTLPRPFFAVAPMADVTDPAFRRMFSRYGKPDVMWTEFVSADGLMSAGRDVLLRDLRYVEEERPIVAQIFSSTPEHIEKTAALILELGFDGVDINMGCPDKNVEKQGAGASLIKNPTLAQEIIAAAKQGARKNEKHISVSVKTRVGYNTIEVDSWIPKILESRPDALTIHARTRKEMSLVPARWEHVGEVVSMAKGSGIPIIGNGDVVSREDGILRAQASGADGVMVGRGIFGNPWFFNPHISINNITIRQRLEVMLEHTRLFLELNEGRKSFAVMKKHYKAYVHGFDCAKDLRILLMNADTLDEIEHHVFTFIREHDDIVSLMPGAFVQ